jgi:hypothetical protein
MVAVSDFRMVSHILMPANTNEDMDKGYEILSRKGDRSLISVSLFP